MTTISRKTMTQIMALTLCVFAFVGVVLMGTAATAFCADDLSSISDAVSNLTNQAYELMRNIIVPCCIVALTYAGFQFLFGGNQGSEKARKVVIGCILALCFVVFAPMIVSTVASMVKSEGTKNWGSYNPL